MKTATLAAAVGLMAGSLEAFGQLFDGGFESPITYDGPPYVGSWEGSSGGPGSWVVNSTTSPRNGAQSLELGILETPNTFAFAFQDVPGLTLGVSYTFSGWHATPSVPFGVGVEVRIEWRDSVGNVEVSRTANLTTPPGASYTPFSLTATVPAGADTARVVYAIQSFGPEPTDTGVVYVDDLAFAGVPEPHQYALMAGVGLLGFAVWRRRQA